jgi:hypothetical protein
MKPKLEGKKENYPSAGDMAFYIENLRTLLRNY